MQEWKVENLSDSALESKTHFSVIETDAVFLLSPPPFDYFKYLIQGMIDLAAFPYNNGMNLELPSPPVALAHFFIDKKEEPISLSQ